MGRKQSKAKAAAAIKKKPAAAGAAVGVGVGAGVLKKPAAAAAAAVEIVCKKPAGSIPTIAGYKITWDPESDKHRDRKTFISLHFHRARKQIPATWSPEDKKIALQPISQMAGMIWDKSAK